MSALHRICIIHGFASGSDDCWFPWLRERLVAEGFSVVAPALPHPNRPVPHAWIAAVRHAVGDAPERCILVSHSLGCQAVLGYAATLPVGTVLAGAVFVGGWLTPPRDDDPERRAIRQPWLDAQPDLTIARTRIRHAIAILSDDDPFAPLAENAPLYERTLHAHVIPVHGKQHFRTRDGVLELPEALDAIRGLTGRLTL